MWLRQMAQLSTTMSALTQRVLRSRIKKKLSTYSAKCMHSFSKTHPMPTVRLRSTAIPTTAMSTAQTAAQHTQTFLTSKRFLLPWSSAVLAAVVASSSDMLDLCSSAKHVTGCETAGQVCVWLHLALFVVLAHISIVANGSRDVLSALRTHSIWREQPPPHTRPSSTLQACRQSA